MIMCQFAKMGTATMAWVLVKGFSLGYHNKKGLGFRLCYHNKEIIVVFPTDPFPEQEPSGQHARPENGLIGAPGFGQVL